jgi:cobalt-zinc-cadmium efflux system membrane fusion protein
MFHNHTAKPHFLSLILISALIFCWLLLPAGTPAGEEHDHQMAPAQSEHQEDTSHNHAQDEHELDDHAVRDEAEEDEHGHNEHEDMVHLTDAEMEEFEVEVDVAGPGKLHLEVVVPGEVAVNYDRLAHIAPRFPGVVTEVRKHVGNNVNKGEVLAVIESNEGLVPYEVKAFINGTVIEKHMTLGEVHSDDAAAFVIADLDTVWVNLSIYQMHLPKVAVGQKVAISAGQGIPDAKGVISYISPVVDQHTRTATARVVLPNRGGRWCPGLFVEGRITVEEKGVALLVPNSALQTMDGQTVVFIQTQEGFRPQPVGIGRANHTSAEVLSGLVLGQKYVSKGGFVFKAELLKGAFGDEHGH